MSGGLYNTLFGVNELAGVLIELLGFDPRKVPRIRDCFLYKDNIVIHTRTGGGNREWYDSEASHRRAWEPSYHNNALFEPLPMYNEDLRRHPLFVRDEDDSYDSTYANFYFSFPEDARTELTLLSERMNNRMPADKWRALLEKREAP